MRKSLHNLLFQTGSAVESFLKYVGGISILGYEAFASLRVQGRRGWRATFNELVRQTIFTGVEALPLVMGIASLIGIIIIIQSMTTMPKYGAGDFFGKIMVLVVIRELGPLLTSIIVIGRSGSALATYIGYMKVNQEIEALEVMGISPVNFLVMPAMLGASFAMVCLTLFFDIFAIFGGYFFLLAGKILNISAFSFELPVRVFLGKIIGAMAAGDILVSVLKSFIFAIVISIIACYHGLNLRPSFTEVPKATRRAVVQSLVITMLLNSFITVVFYSYAN